MLFKMTILADYEIEELVRHQQMILPFVDALETKGKISYGLSSFGYDARVDDKWRVFTDVNNTIIDPKNFDERSFVEKQHSYCIIPPHSFVLAKTIEYFKIPRDVVVICLGKSTYARCGLIVNVTPLEPGWQGHVTIELSNTTPLPLKVYAYEGICQFLFFRHPKGCEISYADRKGKYQGQTGITSPKV